LQPNIISQFVFQSQIYISHKITSVIFNVKFHNCNFIANNCDSMELKNDNCVRLKLAKKHLCPAWRCIAPGA